MRLASGTKTCTDLLGGGKMKTDFTVEDMLSENLFSDYSIEYWDSLWGNRESLTADEIAELDIPLIDRVFILIHLASASQAVMFAHDCQLRHFLKTKQVVNVLPGNEYAAGRYAVWDTTDEDDEEELRWKLQQILKRMKG